MKQAAHDSNFYKTLLHSLKSERSSWDRVYRDIGEYIMPGRTRFTMTDANRGDVRINRSSNNTAMLATRILKSGMHSGITSPARPWFRLTTPDPSLAEFGPVREWLHVVTQRMYTVMAKSNLYNALPVIYGDCGSFGTAAAVLYEDDKDIIRVKTFPVGQYSLASDKRGVIDTVCREFRMTVEQLVGEFGLDNVSQSVYGMYKNNQRSAWIDVMHVIRPNDDHDPTSPLPKYLPYESIYLEVACQDEKYLRKSGFAERALVAPRWDIIGEDVYGYGCGVVALGDTKALQLMEKRKAQAIDKLVNPPLKVPSSLRNNQVSALPGGITYVDDLDGKAIGPLYQVNFDINAVANEIAITENRINRAFFADLFLMLAMTQKDMTATEVAERHEEKLLMLGPVLERLNDELLDPIIDRYFGVMNRLGMIPPAPPELEGVDLKVEHISIMAQAQKMVATAGIDRAVGFIGQLASIRPDVLDKLDADQTVDEYMDMLGIPPTIINSDEEVAAIRQQRAAAAQAQAQMEQQMAAAQTAETLSKANTEGGNALGDMVKGMTGI